MEEKKISAIEALDITRTELLGKIELPMTQKKAIDIIWAAMCNLRIVADELREKQKEEKPDAEDQLPEERADS